MNEHRGVVNRLLWMQDAFGLAASDRVLQKTPFSFDVSVWEFFWPLLTGRAAGDGRPGAQGSGYLAELIAGQEITTLHFVPSMLQVFLEHAGGGRCRGCMRRDLAAARRCRRALRAAVPRAVPQGSASQSLRADRGGGDVTRWTCRPERSADALSRSAGRSRTRRFTFWTAMVSRCRSG